MLDAKDVLFIVMAFCALWFTTFMCWLVYQIASILRNVNEVVNEVHETLGKMERAVSGIRGRFDHAVSGLMLAVDGGSRLMEMLRGTPKKAKASKPAEEPTVKKAKAKAKSKKS